MVLALKLVLDLQETPVGPVEPLCKHGRDIECGARTFAEQPVTFDDPEGRGPGSPDRTSAVCGRLPLARPAEGF